MYFLTENCDVTTVYIYHWKYIYFSLLGDKQIVVEKGRILNNSFGKINQLRLKFCDTSIFNFPRALLSIVVSASALILRMTLARVCRVHHKFRGISIYKCSAFLPYHLRGVTINMLISFRETDISISIICHVKGVIIIFFLFFISKFFLTAWLIWNIWT